MNALRMKRPSPAFVVAMVALFVALGGTAGAVVNAAVPLAKRALVADNAKKLGGQTSAQIAAQGAKAALALSPAGRAAGELGREPDYGQAGTVRALRGWPRLVHGYLRRRSEGDRRWIREPGRDGNLLRHRPNIRRIGLVDLPARGYGIRLRGRRGSGDLPQVRGRKTWPPARTASRAGGRLSCSQRLNARSYPPFTSTRL